MKKNVLSLIILFFLQAALCAPLASQEEKNIDIRFLKSKFTDTTGGKDVVAVLLVTTKDSSGFPPTIKIPPKCTVFEDGREKVVILTPHNLAVALYGPNVREKNKQIYDLIRDVIDPSAITTSFIITYVISDLNYNFTRMSLTPAFEEKKNKSVRVEKRCEFEVMN